MRLSFDAKVYNNSFARKFFKEITSVLFYSLFVIKKKRVLFM